MLVFSGINLARLVLGFDLPDIPLSVPSWYLPLTGGVWGALGLITVYGLLGGHPWTPALARWGSLSFVLWYWTDRLVLASSYYLDITWPAALAVTLLSLLVLFWLLSRPAAKHYFEESTS